MCSKYIPFLAREWRVGDTSLNASSSFFSFLSSPIPNTVSNLVLSRRHTTTFLLFVCFFSSSSGGAVANVERFSLRKLNRGESLPPINVSLNCSHLAYHSALRVFM